MRNSPRVRTRHEPNQNKHKILEIWTRNIEDKRLKDDFHQALVHDTLILGRLDEIIDHMLTELAHSEGTAEDYASPSWAYKAADRIGRHRSLMAIKELIAPAVAKRDGKDQ